MGFLRRLWLELGAASLVSLSEAETSAVRGTEEDRRMKKLFLSTVVLIAGVGLASAQDMRGGGGQSAPAQHQGAQSQGAPGGSAPQERERGRSGQAQQGTRGESKQTTGQSQQREQGMERRGASEEKKQPQRSQRDRDHTTGQSPGQTQPGTQSPQRQQQGQQGQQMQSPQGQTERGQQTQQPSRGEARQGQGGGNVQLSSEQRTQIRQQVLAGGNVPRVNNVNFALSVGTSVPTSVHVVAVPTVLVNIHPEWRGHYYFVVGDEIVIVDSGHRIVAVIAV
jgi:hypothetical protein